MAKKTIVHIAQSAGGVAEYLYMFLKNFKDDNYENIMIVSQDYKEQLDRFKPYTSNINIVPMVREVEAKSDIKSIVEVRKLLKQIKPDIVYLHSSKAGAIGRIALFFNFRTKFHFNLDIFQEDFFIVLFDIKNYSSINKLLLYLEMHKKNKNSLA